MGQAAKNSIDGWIQQAETGRVEAQYEIGLRFSTGQDGAPLDYIMAHKWLNLAAMRGSEDARRLRAELAGDMTRDEIAQAQRLAREWMSAH